MPECVRDAVKGRSLGIGCGRSELHAQVHVEYAAQESPQEAVWILAQPMPLFADGIDG